MIGDFPYVVLTVDNLPRCTECNRLLAHYCSRPWRITCSRCKTVNEQEVTGLPAATPEVAVDSALVQAEPAPRGL